MKNKFKLVLILRIIVQMTAVALDKSVHIRPCEEFFKIPYVRVHRRITIVFLDMRTVQMKIKTDSFGRAGDDEGIKLTLERSRLVNSARVIINIKEPAEMLAAARLGTDEPAAIKGIARPYLLRELGIFDERFLLIGHLRTPDRIGIPKAAAPVAF